MGKHLEVRQALADFSARYGPQHSQIFKVTSVDTAAQTCECIDDEGVEYLVRITPIVTNGQSLLVTPVEGKKILAVRLEDAEDWFMSWAEQWASVTLAVGNCRFESDGTKWTVKNAEANLLDIFSNIIDAVQIITVLIGSGPDYAKLEDARTMLNQLLK